MVGALDNLCVISIDPLPSDVGQLRDLQVLQCSSQIYHLKI